MDGGVGVANIKEIAEAGADFFVAGSAILKNPRTQEVRVPMPMQRSLFGGCGCCWLCLVMVVFVGVDAWLPRCTEVLTESSYLSYIITYLLSL